MAHRAGVLAAGTALLALSVASCLALAGCQGLLDSLAGKPAAHDSGDTAPQGNISVPAGPQLFCISNIGHTLVAFSLAERRVLPDTRSFLDLDPIGPWFSGGLGYYLNRVDGSGNGKNRLVEFLPQTAEAQRSLTFGVNTNPNDFLVLPSNPDAAWVTLRGATFDSFATRHLAVVRNLTGAGALTSQLFSLASLTGDPTLTSPTTLRWDAACPSNGGNPCVYLLVNNFGPLVNNGVGIANGKLLVLAPAADGSPVLLTSIPLGLNPQEDLLLDSAAGELWVVNNGGYPPGHQPGSIQVLETAGWSTVDTIPDGTSPGAATVLSGVQGFSAGEAWITTYPADAIYTVDHGGTPPFSLNTSPGLPQLTGPLFPTALPGPALFAGKGGFGPAHLAELDPATGALLADHDLQSGNGALTCAAYSVP